MKPRNYQLTLAKEGYDILREHMIVYLAMEERTGKSLTAILIAEMCQSIENVLIVTKKNAIGDVRTKKGWKHTLDAYRDKTKKYALTNYHQAHKASKPDLLILDEAHNYISGSPKQPVIAKRLCALVEHGVPIIYLSATPHAQGYQMLFHQFQISKWSPWRKYKTFYEWFAEYGIPETSYFHGRSVLVYNNTQEDRIRSEIDHLFIRKTRKDLSFDYEPKDQLHYLELEEETTKAYNILVKEKVLHFRKYELICDTGMKLRTSLHMLEGGVAKVDDEYVVLNNTEKIDYIKKHWGDSKDIAIYYYYIAEGIKLRQAFKHALILQATSHAEGIDLAHIDTLIIYSQNFSTAQHTQRRARQAAQHRQKDIVVHYLLVHKAVSEQVYNTVSINKQNFVDSVFERYTI